MKKNKIMQLNYQRKLAARLKIIDAQILNDSLTNPLLKRVGEVPDYFKRFIEGSRLVAVLPALEKDNPNSQSYYSVGSIQNGSEQDQIRISPVHMYINENFEDLTKQKTDYNINRCFTFESENSKLYSYEKMPHSQKSHFVKRQTFEEMKEHIIANPVVLFFMGCDDGHVGKRFKNKEEAFEYLNLIDVFEDIFDKELQHHN
jgi:hypothetical protein